MNKLFLFFSIFTLLLIAPGLAVSKEKETVTPTISPTVTSPPTPVNTPSYIPAPLPKDTARNLSFDIISSYKSDVFGSNLFSIGDLYAQRKLDEYSVTTDFQVRFEKNLSVSDNAQVIDLRLAKITYLEPWLQLSIGRFDIFPVLTPMQFFGGYSNMGIHRVDGAMLVLPLTLNFGIQNYESYNAPPLALTVSIPLASWKPLTSCWTPSKPF